MKILAIGGTGQLGHFVGKHLSSKGHELTAVGIGNPPEPGFLPESTRVVEADINKMDTKSIIELISGHDVIVFAAGADGRNLFDAPAIDGFRKNNVQPVVQLISAMKSTGSKRLIILGSYYTAMHRAFPKLNIINKSPYILSRWEQIEAAFASAGNSIDVGILELPYIFGAAPNRGTLWGFYIDTLKATDTVYVHSGGTACITMNQVGIATANACEIISGHQCCPIGNVNWSYAEIFESFAKALNIKRNIVPAPPEHFMQKAEHDKENLKKQGKESAYDPIGLLQMESQNFFIDPQPMMQLLQYGFEDINIAIKESVEASLRFESKGPGQIYEKK